MLIFVDSGFFMLEFSTDWSNFRRKFAIFAKRKSWTLLPNVNIAS